jgi:magnesium transporter
MEGALPLAGASRASACLHDADGLEVRKALGAEQLRALAQPQPGKVRWLRIEGLADRALVQAAAEAFSLHPLALEDVLHQAPRPKLEAYEHGYFLVLPRFSRSRRLKVEPLCLFLGDGWVLSFSSGPVPELDLLESRLGAGRGRIREGGPDRLLHHIVDAVIDAYLPLLSALDEGFARVEGRLQGPRPDAVVYGLRELRSDLFRLHMQLRALHAALAALHVDRDDWLDDKVQPYVKDLMDHVSQSLDHVENLREGVSEAQQLYHAILSQRINDVMRVLTIMSAIFMPLSFIAGVYGMNFEKMPELSWTWGYPFALALMAAVAAGLLWFFNRKGWLGRQDPWALREQARREEEEARLQG